MDVLTRLLRRRAKLVLRLAVSAALLGLLLEKAGTRAIGNALGRADGRWVAAALLLGLVSTLVQATQWQALLRASGLVRGWGRCLRLVFVGSLFNTVLPGSVGGDVVRALMVAEYPGQRVAAAATVVLQRLCNFPGMIVLAATGLVLTAAKSEASTIRPITLAGIGIGIAGLALAMSPILGKVAAWPWLSQLRLGRPLARLLFALDRFRGRRRDLLAASARGLLFWTLSVLNQWAFMHALGIQVDLAYAAVVVTAVNALTMLPISINGYGVREGAFVAFLGTNVLASAGQAIAVGLSLEAQSLLWAAVGLVCWLTLPQTRRGVSEPRMVEVGA